MPEVTRAAESSTHGGRRLGIGQLHVRVSLLSVGVSLSMLFLGGPPSLYPLGGLTLLTWLWRARRGWSAAPLRPIHPALLLTAAGLWYPLADDLITFLIGVVVGLTLARLCALRSAQSFTQLYILSFAQVTLSAQLEGGLSYGLLLACYMVLVTVSLTLNHLRAQLELESEPKRLVRRLSSPRLLPQGFVWGVGLIAGALCVLSLALFFALPRVGGQWFHSYQRGAGVTGFSGEVSLGEVSAIQKDQRVAFRVTLSRPSQRSPLLVGGPLSDLDLEEVREPEALVTRSERYWAGRRLDRYQAGRWSHRAPNVAQRFAPQLSPLHGDTHWLSSPVLFHPEVRARLVWQDFFIEQRGHQALFSLTEPLAVVVPRATPVRPLKVTEDQSLQYRWEGSFRYQALSLSPKVTPLSASPLAQYRAEAEALPNYGSLTQLPADLEAPLLRVASPIVREAQSAPEAAQLLSEHLQSAYRYSLDQLSAEGGLDPVLYFLEVRKAGHCEYFSSALALMLRALGLPARVVTGYRGGEWNEYGSYLTVHHRDAHAWVELWVGGDPLLPSSWRRFDPTPASASAGQGRQGAWRRWLDQLEFMWLRYVVGFEAQDQVKALHKAEGELSSLALSMRRWWYQSSLREALMSGLALCGVVLKSLTSAGPGLLLLPLLIWALRWRRAQRSNRAAQRARSSKSRAPSELYARALKAFESAGFPQAPEHLTSAELFARFEGAPPVSLSLFTELTARYERLRFGEGPPERRSSELSELKRLVAQLEGTLSAELSEPPSASSETSASPRPSEPSE